MELANWCACSAAAPAGACRRPAHWRLAPGTWPNFPHIFQCSPLFPDFLGRLQPSKTTTRKTPGTLGEEKMSCPRKVLHFYTSNSARGRMRAELWRFKISNNFPTFLGDFNASCDDTKLAQSLLRKPSPILEPASTSSTVAKMVVTFHAT